MQHTGQETSQFEDNPKLARQFFAQYKQLKQEGKKYEAWDKLGQAIKYGYNTVKEISDEGYMVADKIEIEARALYNGDHGEVNDRFYSEAYELATRYIMFDRAIIQKPLEDMRQSCLKCFEKYRENYDRLKAYAFLEEAPLYKRIISCNIGMTLVIDEEKRQMNRLREQLKPRYLIELRDKIVKLTVEAVDYAQGYRFEPEGKQQPDAVAFQKIQEAEQLIEAGKKAVPEDPRITHTLFNFFRYMREMYFGHGLAEQSRAVFEQDCKKDSVTYDLFNIYFVHYGIEQLHSVYNGSKKTMTRGVIPVFDKAIIANSHVCNHYPHIWVFITHAFGEMCMQILINELDIALSTKNDKDASEIINGKAFHEKCLELAPEMRQPWEQAVAGYHAAKGSEQAAEEASLERQFRIALRSCDELKMTQLLGSDTFTEQASLFGRCKALYDRYQQDLKQVKKTAERIALEVMTRARGDLKFKDKKTGEVYFDSVTKKLHAAIETSMNQGDRNRFLIDFWYYIDARKTTMTDPYKSDSAVNELIDKIQKSLEGKCLEQVTKWKKTTLHVDPGQFDAATIHSIIATRTERFQPEKERTANRSSGHSSDTGSSLHSSEDPSPTNSRSHSPTHKTAIPPQAKAPQQTATSQGRVAKKAPRPKPKVTPLPNRGPVFGAGQHQKPLPLSPTSQVQTYGYHN